MSSRRPTSPRARGSRRPDERGGGPRAAGGAAGGKAAGTSSGTTGSNARPGGSARPVGGDASAGRAGREGATRAAPRTSTTSSRPGSRPAGASGKPRTATRGSGRRRALRWGSGRDGEPRPTISLRALGLLLVGMVAFVVLAPTLRYAVTQQEELRSLNAEVAAAEQRTASLEADLERWADPEYVQSQARDRLGYVVPGETPYVVVDPETVVGEETEAARQEADSPAPSVTSPWYLTVWESIETASRAPLDGSGERAPGGGEQ